MHRHQNECFICFNFDRRDQTLIRLGRVTLSIMSSDEATELSGSAELTEANATTGASCEVNGVKFNNKNSSKTGAKL
jgi:hypothetical protein